jgi:hypothetical protein
MEYLNMKFNGKPWAAPENCNHGWDGRFFWTTPKGKCVKCSADLTNVTKPE